MGRAIRSLFHTVGSMLIPRSGRQIGNVAGTPYLRRDATDYDLPRTTAAEQEEIPAAAPNDPGMVVPGWRSKDRLA